MNCFVIFCHFDCHLFFVDAAQHFVAVCFAVKMMLFGKNAVNSHNFLFVCYLANIEDFVPRFIGYFFFGLFLELQNCVRSFNSKMLFAFDDTFLELFLQEVNFCSFFYRFSEIFVQKQSFCQVFKSVIIFTS